MKNNQEIRTAALNAGVRLWQIADALGITDASFSRLLRHELTPEKKQQIFQIIDQIREEVI